MKRKFIVLTAVLLIAMLAGCAKKESPADRLAAYTKFWNDEKFTDMYTDYLSSGTKKTFDQNEFAERQEKLIEDLSIDDLEVTYKKPKEDAEWDEEQPAVFPIHIKMDTAAGPVEFDKDLTFIYEEQDEEKHWYADWDPSFIFPGLTATDTVQIQTTKAVRGKIFDRNGKPIAMNGIGYEAGIVPGKFTDAGKKADVAKLLNTTVEFIDKQLNQSWVQPDYFVPIGKVAKTDEALLAKLIEIPGMTYQETAMREYPYGASLAHLSGYIGPITAELLEKHKDAGYTETDLIGRQGLERILEDRLRGENGVGIYMKGPEAGSTPEKIAVKEAVDGEDITLTIDADLQKKTYDAMRGETGTAAAVDPLTGETLVLTSSPSFDPAEFMLGISGERYKTLSEDPKQPLFNRFAAAYAPGSSIKPITAAVGLEAGTLKPDAGIMISGKTWQKDSSWGSYRVSRFHPEAPNPMDLNKALIYSDNIYFAQQALAMGKEKFISGLKRFGFGEEIPFALNLTPSQISNDGTLASEGQLADTSFGQGQMLTNILHLAVMYEPIITNGLMYKPTLYKDDATQQVWQKDLLTKPNADELKTDLRNVVLDGFAQKANLPDIPVAGKTGTAELKKAAGESGQDTGFFVSYNADHPNFILAMMIEHVEDNNGSGYVAELAADVYKAYYKK
ncbi:penicillin-binding transpeptidase domain-containing protein [Sporosarcina trichiuri]|uniref:penicillin-binding transpeptidase domain-containing protein n=1 Tax=Sporosarcina trichiuri TaxID=3056445 RepID=UPI0025B5C920|nr:penicillin-binding transpeptidase domain-containing protein [Sporosarcina sp. 0.2-SM1T-5]WJY28135.1 penicillin-binding transpeptidase domain-containing protein [Sporosarcina sp. 0.2-SM1T-5]